MHILSDSQRSWTLPCRYCKDKREMVVIYVWLDLHKHQENMPSPLRHVGVFEKRFSAEPQCGLAVLHRKLYTDWTANTWWVVNSQKLENILSFDLEKEDHIASWEAISVKSRKRTNYNEMHNCKHDSKILNQIIWIMFTLKPDCSRFVSVCSPPSLYLLLLFYINAFTVCLQADTNIVYYSMCYFKAFYVKRSYQWYHTTCLTLLHSLSSLATRKTTHSWPALLF